MAYLGALLSEEVAFDAVAAKLLVEPLRVAFELLGDPSGLPDDGIAHPCRIACERVHEPTLQATANPVAYLFGIGGADEAGSRREWAYADHADATDKRKRFLVTLCIGE